MTTVSVDNAAAAQTSSKNINSIAAKIKASGKKFNDLVQEGLIAVIVHANTYGDCTGAARIIDAMPMSTKRPAAANFMARFSPIRIQKDSKTGNMKAHLAREDSDGYTKFDVDGAKAAKWYEGVEIERTDQFFTIEDADDKVKSLAESIERKITRNQVAKGDIPRLAALAAALKAVHADDLEGKLKPVELPKAEPQVHDRDGKADVGGETSKPATGGSRQRKAA